MSLPDEWPYDPPAVGPLTSWLASSPAPALMIIRSQVPPPTGAGTLYGVVTGSYLTQYS